MLKRKGQVSVEYAALVIIVIGAFIAAGNYFKRGIQGRWKSSIDELGDQYDPRVTNADISHTVQGNTQIQITTISTAAGIWSMRDDQSASVERKIGTSAVGAF